MHRIFRVKAYEAEHGPHFNEEHARKAVSKAAAMGAYAGDAAFNGVGYNNGCGCGCGC